MYKITSSEDGLRKFLRKKIWSLGTSLGYLGPVSQADPDERFFQPHFLVVWTPYDYPELMVSETQAKNLKTIGAWCEAINPPGLLFSEKALLLLAMLCFRYEA